MAKRKQEGNTVMSAADAEAFLKSLPRAGELNTAEKIGKFIGIGVAVVMYIALVVGVAALIKLAVTYLFGL